jgi:hypothetical protein
MVGNKRFFGMLFIKGTMHGSHASLVLIERH